MFWIFFCYLKKESVKNLNFLYYFKQLNYFAINLINNNLTLFNFINNGLILIRFINENLILMIT